MARIETVLCALADLVEQELNAAPIGLKDTALEEMVRAWVVCPSPILASELAWLLEELKDAIGAPIRDLRNRKALLQYLQGPKAERGALAELEGLRLMLELENRLRRELRGALAELGGLSLAPELEDELRQELEDGRLRQRLAGWARVGAGGALDGLALLPAMELLLLLCASGPDVVPALQDRAGALSLARALEAHRRALALALDLVREGV